VNRSTITKTTTSSSKKNHLDSGIEYDQTSQPNSSSSSTIYNQRTIDKKFLIPPITSKPISQSKSVQRLRPSKTNSIVKPTIGSNPLINNSYVERLRQTWLPSLLLGLLLLLLLFFVYFSRLDRCTRSTIIRTVFQKIICIENEGLPTI
jgi:predicted RND superfamily exporter protein